jgi:DNA-binding transcriptional MerR regulator/methylmalonyl-CoA mutase cobalamin-binding subunit
MNRERSDSPRHPIRVVARRTGLSPALLRAWEKRYGVVEPSRTEGGQRLYTDDDVLRLSLLNRAVEEGRSISQVAGLGTDELEGLVREDAVERRGTGTFEPVLEASAVEVLERAQEAVNQMDPVRLERVLTRGAMAFSVSTTIDEIVVPLLQNIGAAWEAGRMGPAHEHLATGVIRRFLEWMLGTVAVGEGSPVLVAATPAGERHELGALLSALSGAAVGWRSFCLGPDLPAEEIASAAMTLEAEVVALSCVDSRIADGLPGEVGRIRSRLPEDVRLIVGGRIALLKEKSLRIDGVQVLRSFNELRSDLRESGMPG